MNITTNRVNSANATISATIANAIIEEHLNKIAKQLSKTANIAGFRKGKIPIVAVKKQYGDKLNQDAESQALQDVLSLGLDELKIDKDSLIGEPQISKFDKSENEIVVEVNVAIRPDIDLGDYASVVPEVKKPEVSKETVDEHIKTLAEQQATYTKIEKDRALKDGDMALIDFVGTIDNEEFQGGRADNFSLKIGSGHFIPGFEEQMIGMNVGESKDIKVTFPKDYQVEDLAGKEANFAVSLLEIREREEIVFNDELAKNLSDEEDATLETLREDTKDKLENLELTKLYNEKLKPELMKIFIKTFDFDLPDFVVEQEIDIAINKAANSMNDDEINEIKENADKLKELRESKRDEAIESVKATFIVDALAKAEDIQVTEHEVMLNVYTEALQAGMDAKKLYEEYYKAGILPAIQMSIVEDRILSKLLDAKMKGE